MRVQESAIRAYGHGMENLAAIGYIARRPQELARNPRWLRQRTAATMALRMPWWPYAAVAWMEGVLPYGARVFEYGGGGSTLWLADRGAAVTVAEHDESWYRQLKDSLPGNVKLLFRPPSEAGAVTSPSAAGFFDDYAAVIDDEADGSLDLVIVDGRARVECTRRAMPKVSLGGLLLLDDTDRGRYKPAIDRLRGWKQHVFTGLKPGQRAPAQTSVWERPLT